MRIRLTGERGYQDSVIDWDGDFSTTILLFYPRTLESSEYNFQRIDVDGIPVYVCSGRKRKADHPSDDDYSSWAA
jgi:hypothetical protein